MSIEANLKALIARKRQALAQANCKVVNAEIERDYLHRQVVELEELLPQVDLGDGPKGMPSPGYDEDAMDTSADRFRA